ncbi:hypothetical protein PanWU01x14_310570 [Parasponia andersonii]|uniref:Tf2-1-like SH3-like domain-containing protein n=1 Tax=Parasponia andersonii TaxID=3476 RepID=A0A2P5AQA5_PARAD|nr:hypothetical protein PanWU01x14_310570 [Parasponia andersonii]
MVNRSMDKSPFSIVYISMPKHTVDLINLPKFHSKPAENFAEEVAQTYKDVKEILELANAKYKEEADKHHRRKKTYQEGDLVMIHLRKQRFLAGIYNKLQAKNFGPFRIIKKINDNAYMLELPPELQILPTFNFSDIYYYFLPDDDPTSCFETGSSSFQERGTDAGA